MLTPEGAAWLLRTVSAAGGWRLAVSDGSQRAVAESTSHDVTSTDEGAVITLRAEFGADEANFTWAQREVLAPDGTVVDRAEEDGGRKAPGAIWSIEAELELTAEGEE